MNRLKPSFIFLNEEALFFSLLFLLPTFCLDVLKKGPLHVNLLSYFITGKKRKETKTLANFIIVSRLHIRMLAQCRTSIPVGTVRRYCTVFVPSRSVLGAVMALLANLRQIRTPVGWEHTGSPKKS